MKAKLLILGLFCWFGTFAQSVPNTTNFALSDVASVVTGIGSNDLVECFAHAVDAYFDPTYKGSKNSLYCFRNYTIPSIVVPTVTTTAITSITGSGATSGGNVTSDGGASVTARGVCWNTSTNPATANSHTSNGTGTGSFTSSLTSLTASTTYYVRAYATNSVGTSYGSNLSFTTSSGCPSLGDYYQGGYVFYILSPGDAGYSSTTCHGLISSRVTSTNAWGCSGDLLTGCSGFDYGDGSSNTIQIEAQCPDVYVAARRCTELTLAGYSDWYLPSSNEAVTFMNNSTYSGANHAYIYWTSTQLSSTTASVVVFTSGGVTSPGNKTTAFYYTPIRSF